MTSVLISFVSVSMMLAAFFPSKALAENPSFEVTVPQNQIDLQTLNEGMPTQKTFHLELSASSWSPDHFTDSSYLSNVSDFKSAGTPQVSLLMWGSGWDFSKVNIAPKFGFAYSQFQRTGDLGVANGSIELSQKLNLYSLFLGAEMASQKLWWSHLRAYLDLGLMPIWAQAAASNFSNGTSENDWAFRESAGLAWSFAKNDENVGANWALEAGVETTQGLQGASLSGVGYLLGLRVSL